VEAILSGLQIILCVVLIVLILLHSGKDAGLSGAFGVGSGAGPFGGGSLVERNLNRWTIAFALVYGALILDEPLRASALAGMALILGGVALGSGIWRPLQRTAVEGAP